MMLRELYRIGLEMKRERGPEWPVEMYEERKIRWEVWLTEDATLRPNGVKSFDPKDKAAGRIYAPDVYRSGKKPPPYLVVDKPEYVLGVGKDGEKQHEAYLALLDECACATGKQGVRAIRDYLSSHRSQLRDEMARQGLTENGDAKKTTQARDWINFKVGDAYPIEAPEISAWWAQYTRDEIKDSDEVCCISRIRGKVTRKFPVSIPVVELDERGRERRKPCRLASVDSPACKSYGFDKSDHAPMSHDAALIAGTALKLMLSDEESSKRLGDVNFAFWTREKRVRSGIGALISGRPEDEAKLADVKALLEGRQVYPAADKFYMLAITNTESRIVIRASIEAALGEVIGSFRDWSASVAVCGPGADLPSIWSLHTALQVSNERQNRNTAIALVERAFFGAALDRALYASVFPRIESSIHRRDSRSNKKAPQWRCPLKEHVSIIKLYLSQSNEEVKDLVALNESFRSVAYQYGRLMAVYEAIQIDASPNVQSTVTERFFSPMMLNPIRTVAKLDVLSKHHLRVVTRDKGKGAAVNLEKRLEAINWQIECLDAAACGGLSLDDRGLFVLGYWHERFRTYNPSKHREETQDETESADDQQD